MGGGGGGSQPTNQTVTQSNLPEYARPFFEGLMYRAEANLTTPYQTYGQERIADFTGQQRAVQNNILNQQTPGQFGTATGIASDVANRSIAAGQYTPGQFSSQQISGLDNVRADRVTAQNMQAAQSGYNPNLNYFQMQGPQMFGGQQAQQYMSPFIQQALEPQMREAVTSARRGQVAQDLGSARQGTYGGSRQLLASMERERNLGQQMGDIQARGMQSAYENAQQQFERDRAAGMTAGAQNQQAALQTQQLGTQTGLQVALANLSNEQQARVNNQAQQFQAQGMNAENALRAALANQQTSLAWRKPVRWVRHLLILVRHSHNPTKHGMPSRLLQLRSSRCLTSNALTSSIRISCVSVTTRWSRCSSTVACFAVYLWVLTRHPRRMLLPLH